MSEYDGPSYPLEPSMFRHAVAVGLGRAVVHIKRYGAQGVRDEIFEAATTCKTYDPQVEGLPVRWLVDLCTAADIVRQVVDREPAGSHWDRYLRCALLKDFAADGDLRARESLYAECERVENSSDVYGQSEIVELDGERGLLFVAQKLGELASTQADFFIDDSPIRAFDAFREKGEGFTILRTHAGSDPKVVAYLQALETSSLHWEKHVRPPRRSTSEVIDEVSRADRSLYWLCHWGRHASPEELEHIVGLLDEAESPRILENTLRCLSCSKTPPLHPAMFSLLRHADENVRLFASRSLAHHVQTRIRDEGLSVLSTDITVGLTLLRKNARSEDAGAIFNMLAPISDADLQHSVVSDVVRLLKENDCVRDRRLALYVYEHSPCTNCRGDAVELLLKWKQCPDWLLEEGQFDASEEIRGACSTPDFDAT